MEEGGNMNAGRYKEYREELYIYITTHTYPLITEKELDSLRGWVEERESERKRKERERERTNIRRTVEKY